MPSNLPADYIPNKVRQFISQLVYAKPAYLDVVTMALAVSHAKDAFTTVPYILATSDQPASGKSTIALDVPMLLGDRMESIDRTTTRDALNNMFLERLTPNTAWDDIGKIFGPNGTSGSTTNFYTVLVKSYRKDATTSMSRNGARMTVSTYGMAWMNGLKNAVPQDLFTRSIHLQMEAAPDGVKLRDALEDSVGGEAKILKEALHAWAGSHKEQFTGYMRNQVRTVHPKLEKRRRQTWGPIFAAASAAGGEWPRKIFDAFVAIALDSDETPTLVPDQKCLFDTAAILMERGLSEIFASDLIQALREVPDGQFYRDSDAEYLVRTLFTSAFGQPRKIAGKVLYGPNAGQRGKALGWRAGPILKDAADMRDLLYPEQATEVVDPLADVFDFEPLLVRGT